MRIGRLSVETAPTDSNWGKQFYKIGLDKPACGCIILDVSVFSFTWFNRQCKCRICDNNVCECICPTCQKTYPKCDCFTDAA